MSCLITLCGRLENCIMMIDFKDYASELQRKLNTQLAEFNSVFVKYLSDNDWFGITPKWESGRVMIDPEDFEPFTDRFHLFFQNYTLKTNEKNELLLSILEDRFPDTSGKLKRFYQEYEVSEEIIYYLTDFLVYYLPKDLCIMNDSEVAELLANAYRDMPKQYGIVLCTLFIWLKDTYKTRYSNDYVMSIRKERSDANGAYDMEEYLTLMYFLFNEDYILEHDMYGQAAHSKNHVDTWLFLALHYICALRNSDLVRIAHPRLTMEPAEVLQRVEEETFPDEDARLTLYSITWRLSVLPLTPNKTKRHSGIASVKFCVPESCEVLIGTLFALAEAHRQIKGVPDEEPLIRCISDYDRITRYMGDEIGSLFLEANFRSRSMNKSYMQSVFLLTDDILEHDDVFHVKGYILAALARSHKGSYGDFSASTAVYLKDAKLSGLTPEFVARELFERGVLSFIPSMLLKMITRGDYNKLPVHKQTLLIQQLDLSPGEVEQVVSISNRSKKQAAELVRRFYPDDENRTGSILQTLHRIANGNAVSKQDECLCLITAMKRFCPYSDRSSCIGCEYEISTKSTVFLMVSEYKRLYQLYHQTSDERIKGKYRALIKETVLPAMDELLQCIQEQYGEEALRSLEQMIKEGTANV